MHKDGKWARQIIDLQERDGKWGWFHSLSQFYHSLFTTEQALRRLERLGYTIEDECIWKAVAYMDDYLVGKKNIPDRKENSKWDMGKSVNDKMYFPLSDDWRKREIREMDCTERIEKLLCGLTKEKQGH